MDTASTFTALWTTDSDFAHGNFDGTAWTSDGLRLTSPSSTRTYLDPFVAEETPKVYEQATWTSEWHDLGFCPAQFMMSWNALTPAGTWIEAIARLGDEKKETDWYVMGRWCSHDVNDGGAIMRTSVSGQHHKDFRIDQDVFNLESSHTFTRCQIGVHLLRTPGTNDSPTVTLLSAAARDDRTGMRSSPSVLPEVLCEVPMLSQQRHRDRYPQWGGGGQVWCSPTSVSMVLAYWKLGPSPDELSWVDDGPDPVVAHAARNCWDYDYDGAGNWPFCTAYAARYGARAYTTWLSSLREAEDYLRAGIPIIASVSHAPGELDGAGYDTDGHLLVIVGITDEGDVICNDPASHRIASNHAVRAVYRRDQFERAWLDHSGGGVYLIVPADRPL